ncbi:hypothetical protein ABB55_01430 [Prosthecomicrobium hirschii]|uniref:HAD family hydrolase n=1 Tax=Prosthecodimorpha hirschii TaxID=665126 RepID=A0A0P6VJ02_9HYPH|nr:hypothetical protein [Prosthecomicrobium hirschii]KPL51046.1 hypothetical protein ABB55_01430 [Prosthecomicrobium hirschii]TPQ52486.1 hypothetical protein C2U72_03015 [Prosthecomicrobium hirschii]
MTLDPHSLDILAAIDALPYGGRPLVVSDVDEVAVYFVRHFERYLERSGFRLDAVSYGLTGNIRHGATDEAAGQDDVRRLLFGFFDDEIAHQEVVEDAVEVLGRLAERADVVLLTNAPHKHRETRRISLAARGLPYPVLTNDGPKGPAMARLAARAEGPVFFLDDSPSNLVSVRETLPDAHVIQFVADPRFFAMAREIPGMNLRANRWAEVEAYIAGVIAAHAQQ